MVPITGILTSMPRDIRMSRTLHVLIHLGRHMPRATSETIAKMLDTNAVVVRRMMAGLREAGYVSSEKGHGGGWSLNRDLRSITILDVYEAIGRPNLFSIGPSAEHPECLVEQAVDARMADTLRDAETMMLAQFAAIAVADLADDFETSLAALPTAARQKQASGTGHTDPEPAMKAE